MKEMKAIGLQRLLSFILFIGGSPWARAMDIRGLVLRKDQPRLEGREEDPFF
jgi:hypothetical protein